jgi:hypothetical protein
VTDTESDAGREQWAENLLFNYSMILMASFEEAFAGLASSMTETLARSGLAMADAMAAGFGAEGEAEGSKVDVEDLGNRTSEKVKDAFAGLRDQARAEFSTRDPSIRKMLSDPAMDEGLGIVQGFDFGLPRLTERLDDDDLSSYLALLKEKDAKLMKMLRELAVWQEKLPRLAPPGS